MKKELYTKRIELLLSPRQKDYIIQMAKGCDLTMNQVMRNMIEYYQLNEKK